MRVGEFWEALAAHNEEVTADRIHIGELVRGETLRLFNLQVKKSDRISDPAKFWTMPWDTDETAEREEEIHRLMGLSLDEAQAEADKFFKKVKHGNGGIG